MGEALIATLGLVLQSEFTDEVKQSWAAVYNLLSNIMVSYLVYIVVLFFFSKRFSVLGSGWKLFVSASVV